MAARGSLRKYTTALVALSMLCGSAASAAPRTIDPLVALSVFGTAESRASVCAAGVQAVAAGAAVAAQGMPGQPGCVLPVMDAAPPPAVAQTPAPAAPAIAPMAAAGSLWPLLLGLAAIAGVAAVILSTDTDGEINLPISP